MLSCDTNSPTSFAQLTHHLDLVDILKSYTIDNIPHLIFHGSSGHSKKTLTTCLLNHLSLNTNYSLKIITIKHTTPIEISYLESPDIIEITPCDYNHNDKHVIMSLIKEFAQTKSISAMFKKNAKKFMIFNEADKMSRDAQAALRRTVEKYSDNIRIIMLCEEINGLVQPIRSRFTCMRVRSFTEEEIRGIIKVGFTTDVWKSSCGNLRKALCLVDLLEKNEDSNKRIKSTNRNMFEYERIIEVIVGNIVTRQDGISLLEIRKEFYELLCGCVPASVILKEMVRRLIGKCSKNDMARLCEYGCMYEERIKMGTKDILHLEGFAASAMTLFYK